MACCNPFYIRNPNFGKGHNHNTLIRYFEVPCGYCLNCRVDRRNWYEDCARANYKEKGYGAFVTFTYADSTIIPNLRHDKDGNTVATLNRMDYRNFLKRFRRHCDYYNLWNNQDIQKDFDYTFVGEYGGEGQIFDRPHFHALFFGLDFQTCKKLFEDCWGLGHVESDPILDGGIRYVLKYLDKQQHGKEAKMLYDDNNIERPFMRCSIGFWHNLIFKQIDFIKAHNYSYKGYHGVIRPLSNYIKRKYFILSMVDNSTTVNSMKFHHIKVGFDGRYSLMRMNDFRRQKANIRERNLEAMARADGQSVGTFYDMKSIKMII